MKKAIDYYTSEGRFSIAAKVRQCIYAMLVIVDADGVDVEQ
jgi:hypothetical protein